MSTVIAMPLVDMRIASAVKALITGQGRDVTEVAGRIGISRNAMYMRLKGTAPFKASEVAGLAQLLGVTIEELYTGLDGRVGPRPTGGGSSAGLPHLDSNQEPTGNRFLEGIEAEILIFPGAPAGPRDVKIPA